MSMARTGSTSSAAARCLLASLVVSGVAFAQAGRDTVRLTDGTTVTGKIKTDDLTGVTITLANGKASTHAAKTIASIEYGVPELQNAISELSQGDPATALQKFEKLAQDQKLGPPVRQVILFDLAYALQRSGKNAEAVTAYQKVVEEFPRTRFFTGIADGLYACLVGKDNTGAQSALEKLGASARSAGADAAQLATIEVRRARVFEASKEWGKARSAYEAARSASIGPAAEAELQLGIARCLVGEGKAADADNIFRALVGNKDASRQVLAGAWNGIGDQLQEEGKKSKSSDRLLEALFAYLRGVVQYAPAPGEATTEHERALANASKVCTSIAQLETDQDRRKLFEQRARDRKQELEREYPSSPYLAGI